MVNQKQYFTISKAQRLTRIDFKSRSDDQLQKDIVKLRDYNMYMNQPSLFLDKLIEGGYYVSATTQASIGIVPKDMWLHHNIQYSLDEAISERNRRQEN